MGEKTMTVKEIEDFLCENNADFELLKQNKPIISATDAAGYYPVEKAAPTFVLQTENCLIGCIVSANNGRLNFEALKQKFGYAKLKMADKKKIKSQTGYEVGMVPLIGLEFPCLFDNTLLKYDYVYGGAGDELVTLKIAPQDVMKLNRIIGTFN